MTVSVLAIESSCDDCSISILKGWQDGDQICYEVILERHISSSSLQSKYGGVVPELAARHHEEFILKLFVDFLPFMPSVDVVVYSSVSGLPSSVMVGKVFAQSVALCFDKKIDHINHIDGHIFSVGLTHKLRYPFLGLVISGKTTSLFLVKGVSDIVVLNETKDHGLGNAFDRLAKLLGFQYPGGPLIEKLSKQYKATNATPLPKMIAIRTCNNQMINYSGLLSHCERYLKNNPHINVPALAYAFQKWISVDLIKLIKQYDHYPLYVSGGCAINKSIQSIFKKSLNECYFCDDQYCCDNSIMIGYLYLLRALML